MESSLVSDGLGKWPVNGLSFAFFSHVDFNLYRFRLPVMSQLVAQGANVYAICPSGPYSPQFAEHNIKHIPFELDRTTFNPFAVRGSIRQLANALVDLNLDVLHSFTLRPNAYGALAGKRANVPVLMSTVTGLGSLYAADLGIKGRIARAGVELLTRQALRHSSTVIFQNPDDRAYYLEKKLCSPDQSHMIVGSGVDLEQFNPTILSEDNQRSMRRQLNISDNQVVVTMIARLLAPKGVHEFLAAARELSEEARFILIGDPDPGNPASLPEEMMSQYVDAGIVIAPGHQENILEWLAISDVFALPSYREGLPRTVLEAMAMGLPIVTTDVPGCRETVIEGENGFLVRAGDSGSLTEALKKVIDDQELRRSMGERSLQLAEERFSTDVIVTQYMELYAELCQNRMPKNLV